jgi:signal transduction histidine kinase
VSGLAPINDKLDGQVLGVLGLDIDAAYYYQSVMQSAVIPVLLGIIALAVVLTNEIVRIRQERLVKMQSELVSIASHDLRSPLAGVRWATESLIPHLDDANKTMAKRILVSATNLQSSIDDLLQITRVASTQHRKLAIKDNDLTDLMRQVCDSQQLAAEQKGVNLEMDQTWNHAITIHCDAERLKRAFQNVVSNAIKYTRDNTTVYINYHFSSNTHKIRISDQGIGIPDNEKQKIFQGFYRASNAKASKIQGTGMGMYLTRLILEQHGGKVTIDSKQDVGTTVTLTLPG